MQGEDSKVDQQIRDFLRANKYWAWKRLIYRQCTEVTVAVWTLLLYVQHHYTKEMCKSTCSSSICIDRVHRNALTYPPIVMIYYFYTSYV